MKINYFGDNLIAAISTRKDGSMKLHSREPNDAVAKANRLVFLEALGINPRNLLLEDKKAVVTDQKGIFLVVMNADCFSLYLHDPIKEVIALAHCGWKEILAGLIEETVEKMMNKFGANPDYLWAFVGPGIRECHFEVGKDVAEKFRGFVKEYQIQIPITDRPVNVDDPSADTHDLKKIYRVDLEAAIIEHLVQAGLARPRIGAARQCTFCYKAITELKPLPEKSLFEYQYFSFRRDKYPLMKSQMAVFGMRESKKEGR